MYNHEPHDYDCPLCRLVRGEGTEITNARDIVIKNDLVTAFIAGKWRTSNPGHVIVIPNVHVENLYDIEKKYLHAVNDMSQVIAIALKKTYKCDGVSTRQHNEPDGNQDVWHFHLHVVPRYKNDKFYENHPDIKWPTEEERRPYAEKLKKYFNEHKNE